ncbi:MAG: DUF2304 domain-containing protein [Planctomycetes bacterium]|nr:DUF2304 domain-containing protein [Planctomycetota bacterium]
MIALLLQDLAGADGSTPLADRQRLVALILAASLVALTFELVRRRKLREEYSWVWITTAVLLAVLALYQDLLLTVSGWIGSSNVVSTLFFGGFLFVMALLLQISVRLSRLTHRHRTLGQRLALLEEEVARLRAERDEAKTPATPRRSEDRGEVA